MRKYLLAAILFLVPTFSFAEIQHCRATINGTEVIADWDNELPLPTEMSYTESVLRWPGRAWNWTWGSPPKCSSQVLIAYLGTTIPPDEIDGYCLSTDENDDWLLVPGERGALGGCARTTCEWVNATKDEVTAIGGTISGVILGTNAAATTAGITVVTHSSGAVILTGNAGYIAGTLGTVGSGALAILTAPATITTAAVSVVAVGGAVYVCSE